MNTLFDDDAQVTDKLTEWYTDTIDDNEVPDGGVANLPATPDTGTESRLLCYEGGHDLSELTVEFSDRGRMNSHAVRWMDRHVRGQNTDVPAVSNYLPGRDHWREDGGFPPADTAFETYELTNGGPSSKELEQGWGWFSDEAVTYEWTVDEDIEVIGEPELELSVDVAGPEARLFFELFHDGDNINGMDQPTLLEGSGRHRVSVTYPAIQEFVTEGDSVGLEISVTNPWYLDSRESDGTTIDARNSRLHLPQRPDANAPEQEDDDDCWWFC